MSELPYLPIVTHPEALTSVTGSKYTLPLLPVRGRCVWAGALVLHHLPKGGLTPALSADNATQEGWEHLQHNQLHLSHLSLQGCDESRPKSNSSPHQIEDQTAGVTSPISYTHTHTHTQGVHSFYQYWMSYLSFWVHYDKSNQHTHTPLALDFLLALH